MTVRDLHKAGGARQPLGIGDEHRVYEGDECPSEVAGVEAAAEPQLPRAEVLAAAPAPARGEESGLSFEEADPEAEDICPGRRPLGGTQPFLGRLRARAFVGGPELSIRPDGSEVRKLEYSTALQAVRRRHVQVDEPEPRPPAL
jgi:hypothetical protein